MLRRIPDYYKNPNMCYKDLGNSSHAMQFVADCYKTQKCVIKLLVLILLQQNLFQINIRLKICDKAISKETFILKYYLDRYYVKSN